MNLLVGWIGGLNRRERGISCNFYYSWKRTAAPGGTISGIFILAAGVKTAHYVLFRQNLNRNYDRYGFKTYNIFIKTVIFLVSFIVFYMYILLLHALFISFYWPWPLFKSSFVWIFFFYKHKKNNSFLNKKNWSRALLIFCYCSFLLIQITNLVIPLEFFHKEI